ncbi:MAG: uridine kinase, partial [Candidatus Eremiobacteraeota bacterium]|nr:uridine kinase [Candidatus Eremiobacteraeota bacterium]
VQAIAPANSILLFDGIFSQRLELAGVWDLCIFLDVGFDETLRRSLVRDGGGTSSQPEMERRFWARYAPGQKLYLAEAQPRARAHLVVDNNDPSRPVLLADRRG